MQRLRYGFIGLGMLLSLATTASAEVSIGIGIGLPNVSIGINLPLYPELVPVPGYPVYYAPNISGNYFFYDGMYWVYQDDNWYASSWYNGPWGYVDPYVVPVYILRVPVSYYRQPPLYFQGWRSDAPPRWDRHWGNSWQQRRGGWDRWNRSAAPRRAPLPTYQREYTGDRYPRGEQQHKLHNKSYRYEPRNKVVRQHLKQVEQRSPAPQRVREARPESRNPLRQDHQQRSAPASVAPQPRGPAHEQRPAIQHEQRPAIQHQQRPAVQHQQRPAVQHEQRPAVQHEQRPAVQHEQRPAIQHQQRPAVQHQQPRGPEQKSQNKGQDKGKGRDKGQDKDHDQDKGQGHDKNEGRGR